MRPAHMPTGLDYDQLLSVLDSTRNDEGPSQRGDFWCCNAKLFAKVAPQGYWNYPTGTEQTPTHAQETNMERQTKLVGT